MNMLPVTQRAILLASCIIGCTVAGPTDSTTTAAANARPLVLLAKFEVSEPGRIELVGAEGSGHPELLIIYRELDEEQPEAAQGQLFTMTYAWNRSARSFLPAELVSGAVAPRSTLGGLFPGEDCLDYSATTTRWDFLLHASPSDVALSVVAPEKPGPRMPVPEQSLKIIDVATGKQTALEPEIQNLYFVGPRAMDLDGDGTDEIVLAIAYYKNRAIYILGRQGKEWRQIALPPLMTYRAAEDFLKIHRAARQRQ
jgi:hypothetical protein